jgi:hypothetical protein
MPPPLIQLSLMVLRRLPQRTALADANFFLKKSMASKMRQNALDYLASTFLEQNQSGINQAYMTQLTDTLHYLETSVRPRGPDLTPYIEAWVAWGTLLHKVWGLGAYETRPLESLRILKGLEPSTFWMVFWEAIGNRVYDDYDLMDEEESSHMLDMQHQDKQHLEHKQQEAHERREFGLMLDMLSPHDIPFENVQERHECQTAFTCICTGQYLEFKLAKTFYEDSNAPSPKEWHDFVDRVKARFLGDS